MKKKLLTYKALANISVEECSEDFVPVPERLDGLICCYEKPDMLPYTGKTIYLRKGALERLLLARDTILSVNKSFSLELVYGYRHPEVQEAYFTEICRRLTAKEKNLSKEILFEKAHMFVAVPEVAGHPTGGAVDLTVLRDGETSGPND